MNPTGFSKNPGEFLNTIQTQRISLEPSWFFVNPGGLMLHPGTPGCTTRADFSTPAGVLRKGVITISPEFTRPTRQILMTSLSGCPLTHSMPITRCLVFSLVKYYDYETVKPNSFPESSGKIGWMHGVYVKYCVKLCHLAVIRKAAAKFWNFDIFWVLSSFSKIDYHWTY